MNLRNSLFTAVSNEVIENLIANANSKNIKIEHIVKEDLVIIADINMLKTVLRNLISNAIKFTYPNGLITITAKREDSIITITIADNGIGITP